MIIERTNGLRPGIPDYLSLSCSLCKQKVMFDYTVMDKIWKKVSPKCYKQSVICLPCFDKLAVSLNIDISDHITNLYFCGTNKTISFKIIGIYNHD